jgi:hypothetical protein
MTLGSTQPLTEMSTRNLPGGKGQAAHKAENLTAICESIVSRKCGSLEVSKHYEPSRPVTLPFLSVYTFYSLPNYFRSIQLEYYIDRFRVLTVVTMKFTVFRI